MIKHNYTLNTVGKTRRRGVLRKKLQSSVADTKISFDSTVKQFNQPYTTNLICARKVKDVPLPFFLVYAMMTPGVLHMSSM